MKLIVATVVACLYLQTVLSSPRVARQSYYGYESSDIDSVSSDDSQNIPKNTYSSVYSDSSAQNGTVADYLMFSDSSAPNNTANATDSSSFSVY